MSDKNVLEEYSIICRHATRQEKLREGWSQQGGCPCATVRFGGKRVQTFVTEHPIVDYQAPCTML
eukprot:1645423-Prymnesium_polylepis.1